MGVGLIGERLLVAGRRLVEFAVAVAKGAVLTAEEERHRRDAHVRIGVAHEQAGEVHRLIVSIAEHTPPRLAQGLAVARFVLGDEGAEVVDGEFEFASDGIERVGLGLEFSDPRDQVRRSWRR